MGCGQSRLENEESVCRCKERRNVMKEAVSVRNAFASVHSAYAMALKNTGAALTDYAQGEAPHPHQPPPPPPVVNEPPPPPPPHIVENSPLPPPPPPLPNFSPVLQRAVTMPELLPPRRILKEEEGESEPEEEEETSDLKLRNKRNVETKETTKEKIPEPPPPPPPESKGAAWDYFFMVENMAGASLEEVQEEEEEEEQHSEEEDFKTPVEAGTQRGMEGTPETAREKHFIHSITATPGIRLGAMNGGKVVGEGNGEDLLKLLGEIDDHFLKASECAQEVSSMLEATRLHYHSNFADNRGHIDHAARVMRVITWNKSFKGVPNGDGAKDDFYNDEYETHATVLDKLLAWEKKLYEEVKAGELIKLEYQKKVALLNKQKKRNASSEALEKIKAAVSHLHTRYIVDMQSLDSTVTEVNAIRDKQLYPKLVDLVLGMARMWESMCRHHESQLKIATELKSIGISIAPIETSKNHLEHTIQLAKVVADWRQQFENLVNNQKSYIRALNSWLKLNLIPIESSLKEKISSPPRVQNPPIHPLLQAWHELLEKLPDDLAKSAISSFEAVIRTISVHQEEEVKLKEKCDETRKEYTRKKQAFEEWYQKYMQRRTPPDEMEPMETNPKDPVSEKQFAVESLEKRLVEEMEAHQKHCIQVREKSLGSLKIRLPELFHSMTDYSHACLDAYERLGLLVQSQNHHIHGS